MRVITCLIVCFLLCAVLTLVINVTFIIGMLPSKKRKQTGGSRMFTLETLEDEESLKERWKKKRQKLQHQIGGLTCDAFGGPSDEVAAEMVYWRDIPKDHHFKNPFHTVDLDVTPKYLTFEPDSGDWNNKRMSLETAAVMALVTGRILVLPPSSEDVIYTEIFPFASIASEYNMKVITMDEFLKREGLAGNLRDSSGEPQIPARTDWDGVNLKVWEHPLWPYLRGLTMITLWNQNECVAVFPDQPSVEGEERMKEYLGMALNHKPLISEGDMQLRVETYTANPTPVDAPPQDRLREMLAQRTQICIYDLFMHDAKFLHNLGIGDVRMLIHFYAMLFFEDWRQDLWVKRFVRDHFRYVDELQCAAARIVEALRELAVQGGDPEGNFDTFHIRRGDMLGFSGSSNVDAAEIYRRARSVLVEGSVVYIATDERDKSFFRPLTEHYRVYYLDDFQELIPGISMTKFGQLDQLVASRGRTFVGLFGSTFTGYINRMRAYHAMKDKVPGYEEGAIPSYYYAGRENKYQMRQYHSLAPPLWSREFPVAWRDIDHDVIEEDIKQ